MSGILIFCVYAHVCADCSHITLAMMNKNREYGKNSIFNFAIFVLTVFNRIERFFASFSFAFHLDWHSAGFFGTTVIPSVLKPEHKWIFLSAGFHASIHLCVLWVKPYQYMTCVSSKSEIWFQADDKSNKKNFFSTKYRAQSHMLESNRAKRMEVNVESINDLESQPNKKSRF